MLLRHTAGRTTRQPKIMHAHPNPSHLYKTKTKSTPVSHTNSFPRPKSNQSGASHRETMPKEIQESSSSPSPPPWEVLLLLCQHLDPKTLARASCVCKYWSVSMSSDHLWRRICLSHYPSLSSSLRLVDPSISYYRLFSLAHAASRRRQGNNNPPKPHLSLSDLIFTVQIFYSDCSYPVLSLVKDGQGLEPGGNGRFKFDLSVGEKEAIVVEKGDHDDRGMVKVTWTAVMKGWEGVFSMMDCKGKGRLVGESGRWFSEELPCPWCCPSGSGFVAEVGLGICEAGDGEMKLGRVSLGLLSAVNSRYASVDDGLRYLQHFLLSNL